MKCYTGPINFTLTSINQPSSPRNFTVKSNKYRESFLQKGCIFHSILSVKQSRHQDASMLHTCFAPFLQELSLETIPKDFPCHHDHAWPWWALRRASGGDGSTACLQMLHVEPNLAQYASRRPVFSQIRGSKFHGWLGTTCIYFSTSWLILARSSH